MQRTPRLTLLLLSLLMIAAPALASNVAGGDGNCPLDDGATVATNDEAPRAAAGSGGTPPAKPARGGEPAGSTPRTRSRWQSLVPGMMK